MTVLSARYADAVGYAARVHASQTRRGTSTPYIAHLLGVSSLVLEGGGDEDLAIAGLLHDAAEDHGGEARLSDIRERYGDRVAAVVRDCSDSLVPEGQPKDEWETRKRHHLASMESASADTMLVWMADKVHNARAIVTDVLTLGPSAMDRFHAPPDRIAWYYSANLELIERAGASNGLVVPLRVAIAQLLDVLTS
jgi:(p)ppGpp synthase/HD superfamily hydrolase